jgi:hypothetical protein
MRKLLALVVVLCVAGLARTGERETLAQLRKVGAKVAWKDVLGEQDGLWVCFLDKQGVDEHLPLLAELPRLRELELVGSDVKAPGMRAVGRLTGLHNLTLNGSPVTDAMLRELKGLRGLEVLSLSGTEVTDAGLAALVPLTGLRDLGLQGCSGITDAGVERLTCLKGIRVLRLRNTGVTEAGIARLRMALPDCRIDH